MKKKIVLIVFLFLGISLFSESDNIAMQILKTHYYYKILSDNEYIGTIYYEHNLLNIVYGLNEERFPTIMMCEISNNLIVMIIKSRWILKEWNRDAKVRQTRYYEVKIEMKGNLISSSCKIISWNELHGIKYQLSVSNESDVPIKEYSSMESEKIGKVKKGDELAVIGIGQTIKKIDGYEDYWFEVIFMEKKGYIFGYYLDFPNSIALWGNEN